MIIEGRVWKLGSDVDTDQLLPGRYLTLTDPAELGRHCLEDLRPEFSTQVKPGDILVAGENMGCGSSREHAPLALKALGIAALVSASYARIFYRNAINLGLPALTCPEATVSVEDGDTVRIDLDSGRLENLTRPFSCSVPPLPGFLVDIIQAGGMTAHVRRKIREREKEA